MKKTALALIIVILLTSTSAAAYYVSLNYSHQGESSLPTAPPTPTTSPSPITTPTPTPTSNPSSLPTISAFFDGPLGGFGIASPSNKTYSSNALTLVVTGQVIVGSNVELFMTYSLDGKGRLPIPIETHPSHPGLTFVGVFNGSVTLPQLSEGSHSITVFGDLDANGHHLAQATVYFTIQGS
jgi:hypothetical protein